MNKITLSLLLLFFYAIPSNGQVVINEILASNTSVNVDEDNSYQDWVELYNAGDFPVPLLGYGLSDDPGAPYKWVFPAYVMAPGEHKLIFCSDKNRVNPLAPLHTNWKISTDGETITLTAPLNITVDQVPGVALTANVSYGRVPSGGTDFTFFNQPTPGLPNVADEMVSAPEISVASGFYDSGFMLSITHPDPEVSIVYTLDGSLPDPASVGGVTYPYKNAYPQLPGDDFGPMLENSYQSFIYQNPIAIEDQSAQPNKLAAMSTTFESNPGYMPAANLFKSTVVRARAVKNGQMSQTVTRNYIVTENAQSRFSLPVAFVNLPENALFDYDNGIHVAGKDFDDWRTANPDADPYSSMENANFHRSGDATEMPAHFSLFINHNEVLSQDIGLRINGNFTRTFPQKSLRLYARSDYGNSSFGYPVFGSQYDSYKRLLLRNGGNDGYGLHFRDALAHKAVKHMNMATMDYKPAVTFVNGEYWGILNLRERIDKHYFERVYGIADGELDFLEYNGYLVQEGDYNHWAALQNYLETNSLASVSNYNYIRTQIDVESFIDHFLTYIYARNTDWPHNNIEFWRKKTAAFIPGAPYGHDGRWRWIAKDLDFGFGLAGGEQSYEHNTLAFASSVGGDPVSNPEWSTFMLRKLLENTTFKNAFINRFADMLNTTFLPSRMLGLIDEMKSVIEPEIAEHGARWSSISPYGWQQHLDIANQFVVNRPAFQRQHIQEKFGITAQISVALNVNEPDGGHIKINTIDIKPSTPGVSSNPYPWSGVYFRQIPVKIEAIAANGYVFSHWSGSSNSTNPVITIAPQGNLNLTAHFLPTWVNLRVSMYFWMIDTAVANDVPLTQLESTFSVLPQSASLDFQSCLTGYPFDSSHANWRKASMERRNSPTEINYIPAANNGVLFPVSNMRGLQIKQPFVSGENENALIFNVPSSGYEDLIFKFAAKNENAAQGLIIEYSAVSGNPAWVPAGILAPVTALTDNFTLYQFDLTTLIEANDNDDLKIRIRFTGNALSADNGDRVTFNNFSLEGRQQELGIGMSGASAFTVYPNPATDYIHVKSPVIPFSYELFSLDGKRIGSGQSQITVPVSNLTPGLYLLKITAGNQQATQKIFKR